MFDYWLWDSVLPEWFCEEQIKNINWEKKEDGKVGQYGEYVVNKEKRITDIVWLPIDSPIGCIAQVYINMANEKAGWNFNLTNTGNVQIGKYDGNTQGFYDWHQDDGIKPKKDDKLIRKLSISILLSSKNNFEGGVFEFKDFEKQPTLNQGSIIVFPSLMHHRVTPVTSGTRYSAVTWVQGPAYR